MLARFSLVHAPKVKRLWGHFAVFFLVFLFFEIHVFCTEFETDSVPFQSPLQISLDRRQIDDANEYEFDSLYSIDSPQSYALLNADQNALPYTIRGANSTRNSDGTRTGLYQGVGFSAFYIPGWGNNSLEMTQIHAKVSFGLPLPLENSFFLVTPSFAPTFMDYHGALPLPQTLYSASIDLRAIKRFNSRLMAMVSITPQWSSDGRESQESVRYPFMGNLIWNPTERWKVVVGVGYFARNDYGVLPFGGLIWQPNDDWKIELMAPQIRVAKRWNAVPSFLGNRAEYWRYAGIGFGGGSWAIESVAGQPDVADYNEYSVVAGIEAINKEQISWKLELGYLFSRAIRFEEHTRPKLNLSNSLIIRTSVSF
ncbi:MAG: hypothetical protein LBJ67_00550 [Planctomycetaceae bacterium]|nr:hypothetical protein [Planctomycetaceae bacterium]